MPVTKRYRRSSRRNKNRRNIKRRTRHRRSYYRKTRRGGTRKLGEAAASAARVSETPRHIAAARVSETPRHIEAAAAAKARRERRAAAKTRISAAARASTASRAEMATAARPLAIRRTRRAAAAEGPEYINTKCLLAEEFNKQGRLFDDARRRARGEGMVEAVDAAKRRMRASKKPLLSEEKLSVILDKYLAAQNSDEHVMKAKRWAELYLEKYCPKEVLSEL